MPPDALRRAAVEALEPRRLLTIVSVDLTLPTSVAVAGSAVEASLNAASDSGPVSEIDVSWGDNSAIEVLAGDATSASHTFSVAGPYTIVATASDADPSSLAASASLVVAPAAIQLNAPNLSLDAGESYSGTLATISSADPSPASYVGVLYVDGSTYSTTISPDSSGNNLISVDGLGTFSVGSHAAQLRVTESINGQSINASAGFTIDCQAPVLSAQGAGTITATLDQAWTGNVASFTAQSHGSLSTSDFTAITDFGDGTATSNDTITSTAANAFDVSASHVFALAGPLSLATIVNHPLSGATVTAATTAQVDLVPFSVGTSAIGFTEGQPFPASFATVSDAIGAGAASHAGDYSASLFINGQSDPVTLTADANQSDLDASLAGVTVLPAGAYPAGLYVTEGNNGISNSTYTQMTVNVADAQIGSAQGRSITALVAVPWSGVLASFVDPYLNAQASSYDVTVDYHDGSSSTTTPTVSPDPNVPGGWLVSDAHTFAADGTFTPTITINDTLYGGDAGITAITASTTATVSIAPATLAAADLHIQTGNVAGQTLATIADPASSNAWIGSLTLDSGTYPVSINGSAVQVPSLAYLRPGTYQASINLTSTLGGVMRQLSAGFNIVVANAPLATPVLDGIHPTAATAWTGEVATFADGDTIAPASDFFATIDWGDGSVIVSTVGGSGGVFSVVASHTFDALPSHPMFVQVTNIKALPDQPGRFAGVTGLAPVPLTLPAVSLVVTQGIAVEMGQASFPTIGLLGGAIAPSADDAGNPLLVLSAQVTINGVTTDASFTPGDGGSLLSVDLAPMNEGVYTAVIHDVYESGAGQTLVADGAAFKVYVNPSNQAEEGFAAYGGVALTGVSRSIGPRDAVVITHIDYGDGSSDAFAGAALSPMASLA